MNVERLKRAKHLHAMLDRMSVFGSDVQDDEKMSVLPRRYVLDTCEEMLNALRFFQPLLTECECVIDEARTSFWYRVRNPRRSKDARPVIRSMLAGYAAVIDSVQAEPDKPFVEIKSKYIRCANEWIENFKRENAMMRSEPYR